MPEEIRRISPDPVKRRRAPPSELLISTILVALALILYTIGVWAERLAGRRKPWHLIFFWGGLIFDTTGTGMMMDMTAA